MQERGIVDPDQGCTCSDWVANMSQLRNLLGLGIAHDRDYQTGTLWVPFCFCPWCGQALVGVTNQRDETLLEAYRQHIEEVAWDFVAGQSGEPAMEMVSVNPGGVFGPPLGRDISGQSMTMLDQMLRGKMPMVPNVSIPMVDVNDVAKLHVRAMTTPDAAGKRIVASAAKPASFLEVAQILKDKGYKGPSTRVAPSFLLRFMSLFNREAKGMAGMLGMNLNADNAQTRSLFNWTPIPFEESVLDAAAAVKAITR